MKDLADKYGISSPYGPRSGGFHYGVDIPTPMRSPLYAPEDGVIAFEGDIPAPVAGYPNDRIIILQLPKSFIVFAHLDETVINTGQRVKRGQLIGYTGNSGYSTGPHLHAEEHEGVKAANKGFLAYPSIDITTRFRGQAQGGASELTIIIRPIAMLKVHLKKPLQMYNIETGQPLWNSGDYMEVTGKTNIVRGSSYLIPVDRMIAGEPFGFLEQEVMDSKNKINDTQFDPVPFDDFQALFIYYRATRHPQAEEVSRNHVAAGTTFAAVMNADMAWYQEKVRLLDEVLKKEVPPPLTEQDQKDLILGRNFRAVSREANAKS